MSFLPVVERELRVVVRRRATYFLRAGAATGAFLLCLIHLASWSPTSSFANPGAAAFAGVSRWGLLFCLAAGLWCTADCLARERREATIGFLFLARLHEYDVALGKLMGASLNTIYALISCLPAVALPLLLGGVTAGEFFRMSLVLINSLALSLTICLAVSARTRRHDAALIGSFAVLLSLLVAGPLAISFGLLPARASQFLNLISPLTPYALAFEEAFQKSAGIFWSAMTGMHALTWLALGFACRGLGRTWCEDPVWASTQKAPEIVPTSLTAPPVAAQRCGEGSNPVTWLRLRGDRGGRYLGILGLAGIAILLLVFFKGSTSKGDERGLLLVLLALHTLLKINIALEGGRYLAEDRRSGALDLLLATPLTVKEILRGQFSALTRRFAGRIILTMLFSMGLCVIAMGNPRGTVQGRASLQILTICLVADSFALMWMGMWLGYKSQNAVRAAVAALGWVAFPPLFLVVFPALIHGFSGLRDFMTAWLVISGTADLYGFCAAYTGLLKHLRSGGEAGLAPPAAVPAPA
jgi:hypothetical protein